MLTGAHWIDLDKKPMHAAAKILLMHPRKWAFTFMNFNGKRFGSLACPVACVGVPTVLGIEEKDRLNAQIN